MLKPWSNNSLSRAASRLGLIQALGVSKMPQVVAIYGLEFTRPFQAAGLTFTPAFANHSAAKRLARALDAYNLTGTLTATDLKREPNYRRYGISR